MYPPPTFKLEKIGILLVITYSLLFSVYKNQCLYVNKYSFGKNDFNIVS